MSPARKKTVCYAQFYWRSGFGFSNVQLPIFVGFPICFSDGPPEKRRNRENKVEWSEKKNVEKG